MIVETLTVFAIGAVAVITGWFIGAAILAAVYGLVVYRIRTRQEID